MKLGDYAKIFAARKCDVCETPFPENPIIDCFAHKNGVVVEGFAKLQRLTVTCACKHYASVLTRSELEGAINDLK